MRLKENLLAKLAMLLMFFMCLSFTLQAQDTKNVISKDKQKCIVYDPLSKTISGCKFDEIVYSDDKYWVSKGEKKGVYNSIGETIMRCEFDEIVYSDDKYWVSKGEKKSVYNSFGKIILE